MYLTTSTGVAASVVAAVMLVSAVPVAAASIAAAPAPPEQSLDGGRVDVAAISAEGTVLGLTADDASGQPRDPGSLVYTAESRQVEVGWDTTGIDAGTVFGDTVTLRLGAADGPDGFRAEPQRLPVGEQGTATWSFSAPGTYALTFAVDC